MTRPALAFVLLIALSACRAPPDAPTGAKLTCATDGDCPTGWACRPLVSRCVKPGEDAIAPGIVKESIVLEGKVFGTARPVTLSFDATEKLAVPPLVELALEPRRAFALTASEGNHYTYVLTLSGTEPAGPATILASLVDEAGNEAKDVSVATITLDFAAPTIVSFTGPELTVNGRVSLVLRTSEAAAQAKVTLGTGAEFTRAADDADPLVSTWNYDPTTADVSGPADVDVTLADAAGNESTRHFAGLFTFDFTAPGVVEGSTRVRLDPAPDNLLRTVTAVAPGTSVQVTFLATERLAAPPRVHTTGTPALDFTLVSDDNPTFTYALAFTAGAEGSQEIEVVAKDAAGNEGRASAGTFTVDLTPPPPPDVVRAAGVVYLREPWGSEASAGQRRFSLQIDPAAVPEAAWVIARDSDDASSAAELGRAPVRDGGFTVPLIAADRPVIYAVAVDAAGNASAAADVREVSWVANLRRTKVGSRFENPTTLVNTPAFAPVRDAEPSRALEATQAELDAAAATGGATARVEAGPSWLDRTPDGLSPSPYITNVPMAWDASRGVFVYFGESLGEAQTWEYDPASGRWARRALSGTQPPPRNRHVMTYDASRGRVMLFGGCSVQAHSFDDVWEWDGVADTWIDRTPATKPASWPTGRYNLASAYDAVDGTVLLFGGYERCEVGYILGMDELWAWDGVRGTFTNLTAANRTFQTWPSGRQLHAMAFDRARERAVVFGGRSGESDLWEWNPRTRTWSNPAPYARPPPWPAGRSAPVFAYDAEAGGVLMFGGADTSHVSMSDFWLWNGTAWRELPAGNPWPSTRSLAGAAVGAGGRLVMYGGIGGSYSGTETWEWLPELGWSQRTPTAAHPVYGSEAAYDANRRKFVAFAAGADRHGYDDALWEFDPRSGNWLNLLPPEFTGPRPPGLMNPALAFDAARRKVVLFGGRPMYNRLGDELWEWDTAAGGWTNRTPDPRPAAWPPVRTGAIATYSPECECTLIFGGAGTLGPDPLWNVTGALDDLWEWHGDTGTFVSRAPAARPPTLSGPVVAGQLTGPVATFDAPHGRWFVVGSDAASPLWSYDPANALWAALAPSPMPTPWLGSQRPQAIFHDTARRKLVFPWGPSELDPETGAMVSVNVRGAHPPYSYRLPGTAFDPDRQRGLAVYGDGTWEWDGGAQAHPAWLWMVPFDALGEAPSAVLSLEVRANAGASAESDGAELVAWDAGLEGWRSLAVNDAALDTPAELAASTTDAVALRQLVTGVPSSLVFGVRSKSATGAAARPAAVALDGLELTMRYRR